MEQTMLRMEAMKMNLEFLLQSSAIPIMNDLHKLRQDSQQASFADTGFAEPCPQTQDLSELSTETQKTLCQYLGRDHRLSSTPNLQLYYHGLRSNTIAISHIACQRRTVLCIMVCQTPGHAIYMVGLVTFTKYLLGPLPHLKHGCAWLCMAQLVLYLTPSRLGHFVVQNLSVVTLETT